MKKTVVISLGGSLIVPDSIDTAFLKNFKKTVLKFVKKGYRFVIICGGGSVARKYQDAVSKLTKASQDSLDWIGISATWSNAMLVNILFEDKVHPELVTDPTKKISTQKPIVVASGWKPGWSTDYDAVLLAKQLKADTVINMSNITHVYSADPRKDKKARKIDAICWKHFRQMVGSKWSAGLNAPFDPIASKEAQKSHIRVLVVGKSLSNLENILSGKKFVGTSIHNC